MFKSTWTTWDKLEQHIRENYDALGSDQAKSHISSDCISPVYPSLFFTAHMLVGQALRFKKSAVIELSS